MNAKEAAELIRGIITSIVDNPSQFHISVNVVGQQVTSHGGIGLKVTAVGGGPGSATVGQFVSVGGAQATIAQERGAQAINQQFQALLDSLNAIASQLDSSSPDKVAIERLYRSLLNNWVPGVITSLVGNVLSKVIGL
jgi:hypothetical protein